MTVRGRGRAVRRPCAISVLAATMLAAATVLHAQTPTPPDEAASAAGTVLPVVRVKATAERETATSPVSGFVAKRSATGTKTDTPVAETPQSVSVVTRDQMDAQNVQSVSDALRYSAGVMAEANGPDPRADVITIRGFNAGARSSFRDGLRDYAFNLQGGVLIEAFGLERVDVLRGPASVLYGQGDAGGVINVVTKRPTATPQVEAQLQLGTYDRKQAAIDVGGPLSEGGEWLYRAVALVRKADTMTDRVTDDRLYLAPSLTWSPSAATTLTVLADYQKNKRGQGYQALPRVGTLVPGADGRTLPVSRFVGEPGFDRFDQERASLGWQFEHQLDERWTLRQNARYMAQDSKVNSIYLAGYDTTLNDGRHIARAGNAGRERVNNLVIDHQAQLKLGGDGWTQTVLVGLDHQRLRGTEGSSYTDFPALDVFDPVYGAPLPLSPEAPPASLRFKIDQTGLYAQDQLKFDRVVAVTLGGRYDRSRTDTQDIPSGIGNPQRDKAFTWRAGAVYLGVPDWSPYVGYAKSFAPIVGRDANGAIFEPETGQQVEGGVRYAPADGRVSLLASLFDLRRQNVLTADPNNPNFSVQRGEVRSRGLELEAKASLTRRLDLVVAYTRLDVEVTRSNGPDLGKTPSATPEQIASAWATWALPPSWIPGLKISAGVRHIGRTWGTEEETIAVPAYTLVDAGLSLDLGALSPDLAHWTLAVNLSNLADKQYVATCGYYQDGCRYGYRRYGAATVTYRF